MDSTAPSLFLLRMQSELKRFTLYICVGNKYILNAQNVSGRQVRSNLK